MRKKNVSLREALKGELLDLDQVGGEHLHCEPQDIHLSGGGTLRERTKHVVEKLNGAVTLISVVETIDNVVEAVEEMLHLLASVQFEVKKLAYKSEELVVGESRIGCLQLHPQLPNSR